jgi:hypothetical protein
MKIGLIETIDTSGKRIKIPVIESCGAVLYRDDIYSDTCKAETPEEALDIAQEKWPKATDLFAKESVIGEWKIGSLRRKTKTANRPEPQADQLVSQFIENKPGPCPGCGAKASGMEFDFHDEQSVYCVALRCFKCGCCVSDIGEDPVAVVLSVLKGWNLAGKP